MTDLQSNKEVVNSFAREFSTEDWDLLRSICTDDFRWVVPNAHEMQFDQLRAAPATMTYRDSTFDELLETLRSSHDTAVDRRFVLEIISMTAEGDRVVAEARSEATSIATGRHYRNQYCFMMHLRDGKICLFKEYQDTLHAYDVWMAP